MKNEKTYCNTRYDIFLMNNNTPEGCYIGLMAQPSAEGYSSYFVPPFSGGWWWTWRGSGRSTSRGCSCCRCSCPSSWPSWVTWRPIRKVFRTGSGWCISPPVCPRMSPFLMPWPYVSRLLLLSFRLLTLSAVTLQLEFQRCLAILLVINVVW